MHEDLYLHLVEGNDWEWTQSNAVLTRRGGIFHIGERTRKSKLTVELIGVTRVNVLVGEGRFHRSSGDSASANGAV